MGQSKAESLVQLACFCVVGAINTLVDMAIFSLLYYVAFDGNESYYAIPFAVGYICGVVCSFVLNKIFTFRDKGKASRQWLPFLLVNLVTLGVGQGGMALLAMISITGIVAKLLTVPLTLVLNYIGSRMIFKKTEK